jgi:Fic family protein
MRERKIYNWQQDGWPRFEYDAAPLDPLLHEYTALSGTFAGINENSTENDQIMATVDLMITEALKTSEIEGEYLSQKDLRSSIKINLGLSHSKEKIRDLKAKGAADLMMACRTEFDKPLSQKMLFSWHKMIMADDNTVKIGAWRSHTEPMQVISGASGKVKIHFEAPPSTQVASEMKHYVAWYNRSLKEDYPLSYQAPIRSALAHLYFESIHPFEDGNGRIGRALSDKALSQGHRTPVLLSLSKTISDKRQDYYNALEKAQKKLDVNEWLHYFLNVCIQAQSDAIDRIRYSIKKKTFWQSHKNILNDRATKVIKRMTKDGPDGFDGYLNARKYMAITKCSKATATRDLQELLSQGILDAVGEGRSRSYILIEL